MSGGVGGGGGFRRVGEERDVVESHILGDWGGFGLRRGF